MLRCIACTCLNWLPDSDPLLMILLFVKHGRLNNPHTTVFTLACVIAGWEAFAECYRSRVLCSVLGHTQTVLRSV